MTVEVKWIAATDINLDACGFSNPMEYFCFKANPSQQYSGVLRPGSSGVFSLNMCIRNISKCFMNMAQILNVASLQCFLHVNQRWSSYDLLLHHNKPVKFNLLNMQIGISKQPYNYSTVTNTSIKNY